ncbi:MAG: rhodanese-like domain-containing protein [Nostoc sp. DedVER02]|uniref:rhodanese-like domain-containing protein n=1 Tax=unclassified Nostoc TaxID=2593658 RepID=UPI002AD5A7C9|nr:MULTISPECIES: rhodanese-like domain-containing protein [unclassified Nostoc]MDZ7987363.1 rhodanese-like domain-containing protein [Nostoc sp. DedVER02]MDZ8116038.1 rhodanese-like domain-containing protein [Nostoc sp. DedVER01b]
MEFAFLASSVVPKSHRLNVDTLLKDLPKTQPILLTCLTGQRSFTAAQQLVQKGYDAIYVLRGGVKIMRSR